MRGECICIKGGSMDKRRMYMDERRMYGSRGGCILMRGGNIRMIWRMYKDVYR